MTKKQKLFKGFFLIFLCLLSLAMALHHFVCSGTVNFYYPDGEYIKYEYYGGDAYTGIQHAVADVGNNVSTLDNAISYISREIVETILLTCAFAFTLVFFVFLYLAIKTFMEKTVEEYYPENNYVYAAKGTTVNKISEIERFNELKERGLLSEEEFELKKKQILGI